MIRSEYDALPVADRLNFCERAIGRITQCTAVRITQARERQRRNAADAKQHWKAGRIASALESDSLARADEALARDLSSVLFDFKCWQDRSDTPNQELPFSL